VRRNLAGIVLEVDERGEVIEELAAHLEETCAELRRQGMTEEAAAELALSQVKDWSELRRRIQRVRKKENTMTDRVKQFWLPGLLTFALSSGVLALLQIFGPKPWVVALRGVLPVGMLYIPWLLSLPLVGSMGAFLSHRAGGSKSMVLTSIVFPVLPILAAFLFVIPASLVVDRHHNMMPMTFLMLILGWVLIPGVALLAGGLMMQRLLLGRLNSARIVSN
jgi:hypothetical protein